jgi:hypothetical protein
MNCSPSISLLTLQLEKLRPHPAILNVWCGVDDRSKKCRYFCEFCPFSSLFTKAVAVHVRKHTRNNPHVCSECRRTFARHETLETHMLICHNLHVVD